MFWTIVGAILFVTVVIPVALFTLIAVLTIIKSFFI